MKKKNIIFAIRCKKPSGGALKVRHYYEHAKSYKDLNTLLFMPNDIDWQPSNPWFKYKDSNIAEINWDIIDIAFISGWGWERFIPEKYHYESQFKVIYLVQHPSKLMPEYDRYNYLDKPATRICVSDALTKMVSKIPHVNGDVITIPAGSDLKELKDLSKNKKNIEVLISGLKNPTMGKALKSKLESDGIKVLLLSERMDRKSYINFLSTAKIVVCLPNPLEGFYLPALEAMALDALVICPYAIGNDYCMDGINCFMPLYNEKDIYQAIINALRLKKEEINLIKNQASITVNKHDIILEKKAFHKLLDTIIKK